MSNLIKHTFVNGWKASAVPEQGDTTVNVIFTDGKGTRAALGVARSLARDLGSRIRILAAYAVPFAFSLDHPPADAEFMENLLADWVAAEAGGTTEETFHLYLCRNGLDTLGQVLGPNSLVVIGSKHLWPNNASFIARMLRSIGHRVIFVRNKAAGAASMHAFPIAALNGCHEAEDSSLVHGARR